MKEATTPLVPTGIASEELAARYPNMFKVGDPIGYVRAAPGQSLKDRDTNMADGENVQEQGAEEQGEAKGGKKKPPKKVKEPKEPKAAKEPKEPKAKRESWTPSPELEALIEEMFELARAGDKKACAHLVKKALEARELCKSLRDSGEGLPSSEADGPETLDAVGKAELVAEDDGE